MLDFDGNSIEVVHRDTVINADGDGGRERPEGSCVLTWQKDVARSFKGGQSVVSVGPRSAAGARPTPTVVLSPPRPSAVAVATEQAQQTADTSAKAIIGTLLGAAAGAAVAYAMTKGDDASQGQAQGQAQAQTHPVVAAAQTIYRAIESAPSQGQGDRRQASVESKAPTTIVLQDLEYAYPAGASQVASQARSAVSTGTSAQSQRARTAVRAIEAPPPATASQAPSQSQSHAQRSVAPAASTLIATFIPPSEIPRQALLARPAGPSPSAGAAKSETHLSVRSHHSQSHHSSKVPSRPATVIRASSSYDVPVPAPGPAKSLVGSVLGLGNNDNNGRVGINDMASVAPSDSVSQAGSKKEKSRAPSSHRSHADSRTSKSKSKSKSGSKAESRHSSRSRPRVEGSRRNSTHSTSKKHDSIPIKGEVEEPSSPSSSSSDATVLPLARPGNTNTNTRTESKKKAGSVASLPPALGRTASGSGSGLGSAGGKGRSVVSMILGKGAGAGAGSSVESRAGGPRGWA